MTRHSLLSLLAVALLLLAAGVADDTGTVSIVGKNDDTSDTKTFGLTLVLADKTWIESEPGSATHFFKTKKGVYVQVAPNLVILRDQGNNKRVGELSPLNPPTAKKGDKGRGKADEAGITFHWEIQ
jgi:hypothetical protein